jgi:hypothetical protein
MSIPLRAARFIVKRRMVRMANACQLAKFHLLWRQVRTVHFATPRVALSAQIDHVVRSGKIKCGPLLLFTLSEADISELGILQAHFVPKVIDVGTFRIRPM